MNPIPLANPDLILLNGKITTGSRDYDDAEALAVRGSRLVAIGANADIERLQGPDTTVIDLAGRRVVPGLIDSHVHVVRAGLSWLDEVHWGDLDSLEEGLELVRRAAASSTVPVTVVGGWHPTQFHERRLPTLEEVNALSDDTAIFIQKQYDFALLNSKALELCGITADPEVPFQGTVERDPQTGIPTGLITGQPAFAYCLNILSRQSFERQIESTIAMQKDLAEYGLTCALDLGGVSRMGPDAYEAIYEVARRKQSVIRTRIYMHPQGPPAELDQMRDYVKLVHPGFGDDYLRVVGMGEILFKQYYDGPGLRPLDISESLKDELREASRLLARHRWPVNIHAIHDSSISSILDVWEEIDAETPIADRRFSFSHADAISARNIARAKALGVGIMVQNRMGMRTLDSSQAWGEDAVRFAPPLKTMLDAGIVLGGGTDATVAAPINPWLSIWWMVTGRPLDGGIARDASECLTRAEALHVYSRGSAWFSFDDDLGAIQVGNLADLAVLTDDYFTVPDDEIPHLRSVLTVVGGQIVHDSGDVNWA